MAAHYGKKDISRSVDLLLYCYFVYTYLLDASASTLAFRVIVQLFLSPKAVSRTLRTAVYVVTFGLAFTLLRHTFGVLGNHGVIIDFVGQLHPPTRIHLVFLDFLIWFFQIILIFSTYSASPSSPSTLLPDDPTSSASSSDTERPARRPRPNRRRRRPTSADLDDLERGGALAGTEEEVDGDGQGDLVGLGYRDDFAVDIRLRASLRNFLDAEDDGMAQGIRGAARGLTEGPRVGGRERRRVRRLPV
ncbi:hypothetical protein BC937DRAFT_95077 [Endogone sp. FLAS-F59071]|nr:hypothetical protein BC937DRAFT_95077 [Endogone sp. FLAS-F59071]|eukprot:RUS22915.1 hypothetical protein BC937DRAFT_95077 [Endogone sp. FLAS-F59071]